MEDIFKYRLIRKSLRDFRPLRYNSWDGHAEREHVNRGRDTPNFCPTLQVLDMSTLGDAADINPVIKFLPHTLHVCGRNMTCSPSAWPSRLLYRRGRKSRRDLRITLYICFKLYFIVQALHSIIKLLLLFLCYYIRVSNFFPVALNIRFLILNCHLALYYLQVKRHLIISTL